MSISLFFTETYVSMISVTDDNLMIPVGTDSHQIFCSVTLNSPIGPNISALSVLWLRNNSSTLLDRFHVSETMSSGKNTFSSNLTLSAIRQHDSGEYCCTASIAGNETEPDTCVELKITTDGEYNRATETFSFIITTHRFYYYFWTF